MSPRVRGCARIWPKWRAKLASGGDPMEIAAEWIEKVFSESKATVQAS